MVQQGRTVHKRRNWNQWTIPIAATFFLVLIASCGIGEDPAAQRAVRDAVRDVQPSDVGTVAFDRSHGTGGFSKEEPTREIGLVIQGDEYASLSAVSQRLTDAGFKQSSESIWSRRRRGQLVNIYVTPYTAGMTLSPGRLTVPEASTGVLLRFVGF